MDSKLKTGIVITAGSEIANLVSRSPVGTAAYDHMNAGYNLEHFVNGATQVGAFAGLALTAYGLTKLGIEKGFPGASEKTSTAAGLTAATSVAYSLAHTEVFYNALCNMTAYNHQISNALEVIATVGIAAGLIATGTLVVKDLYDFAASKLKAVKSQKH